MNNCALLIAVFAQLCCITQSNSMVSDPERARRALVTSSSVGGCSPWDRKAVGCIHMFAVSGSSDRISIDFRVPSGSGDFETVFENMRTREVGSALTPSFRKIDFSAFFEHASNSSIFIDGSLSFASDVVDSAITVFTDRPGHELLMLSASFARSTCAGMLPEPMVPIVYGNGLHDGTPAFAKISGGNGVPHSCRSVPNSVLTNLDRHFGCVVPSEAMHQVTFYRDASCTQVVRTVNASVTPDKVDAQAAFGRSFVSFAVLLGDSPGSSFVSYVDPVQFPPSSKRGGGGESFADRLAARVFSEQTFSAIVTTFIVLAIVLVLAGVRSWSMQIEFGDIVIYNRRGSSGKYDIAVAVMDCSNSARHRLASRSILLQPLRRISIPAAGGNVSEDQLPPTREGGDLFQRLPHVEVLSPQKMLTEELFGAAAPSTAPPPPAGCTPQGLTDDNNNASDTAGDFSPSLPPLPMGSLEIETSDLDDSINARAMQIRQKFRVSSTDGFISAAASSDANLGLSLSPRDQLASSALDATRSPEQTPQNIDFGKSKPPDEVPSKKGEKDVFVFVEDPCLAPLPYVKKTFLKVLLDDLYAILFYLLLWPLNKLYDYLQDPSEIKRDGRVGILPATVNMDSSGTDTEHHDSDKPKGGIFPRSLFRHPGFGCVTTDDVAHILSSGNSAGIGTADLVRVNRTSFQQYVSIVLEDDGKIGNDIKSIERVLNDRRIIGTGGSGGDLRRVRSDRLLQDFRPSSSTGDLGVARRRKRLGPTPSSPGENKQIYWPRQVVVRRRPKSREDEEDEDDECLPFIREVWDELQEELDIELQLERDLEQRAAHGQPVLCEEDLAFKEYYIVLMDGGLVSHINM